MDWQSVRDYLIAFVLLGLVLSGLAAIVWAVTRVI